MPEQKPRYDGISINDALDSIASAFNLNADDLIEYAALDPHGGYHDRYEDGFPCGSIWRVEGQILYSLVRTLRPLRVLELGTHRGCSAAHLAQGIHDNERGTLTCVSLEGCQDCLTPAHLLAHIEFIRGNMFPFLETQSKDKTPKFDFIFEDGSHSMEDVEAVWRAAYHLLKPGGVMVTHDAEHFLVGQAVREGIARAGYFGLMPPARTYLIEPSDCGICCWRKPDDVGNRDEMAEQPKRKAKVKA